MTAPLTPERLAEMRARCEAATAGNAAWRNGPNPHTGWTFMETLDEPAKYSVGPSWPGSSLDAVAETYTEADAAFIAHARTDLPDALNEIARLTALVAERDAEIARLKTVIEDNRRLLEETDDPELEHQCRRCGHDCVREQSAPTWRR